MLDWEIVVKNKELLESVEKLVDKVADIYYDFPEEICEELNSLTGNDWTGDDYLEYCAGYYESPWTLEEVVFALFHNGELPDKKEQDVYVWKIEQQTSTDEEVISFFRFGGAMKNRKKAAKYDCVCIKQIYEDICEAFVDWDNDRDEWEKDNYKSFMCSNKESYGYEKIIYIYSGYDHKFLNCTFTNLGEEERNLVISIMQKYCNHIAMEEER